MIVTDRRIIHPDKIRVSSGEDAPRADMGPVDADGEPTGVSTEIHIWAYGEWGLPDGLLCGLPSSAGDWTDCMDFALGRVEGGAALCGACAVFAERIAADLLKEAKDELSREIHCGGSGSFMDVYRAKISDSRKRLELMSAARERFAGAEAHLGCHYDDRRDALIRAARGDADFDPDGDEYVEERGGRDGMEYDRALGPGWEDIDEEFDPSPLPAGLI